MLSEHQLMAQHGVHWKILLTVCSKYSSNFSKRSSQKKRHGFKASVKRNGYLKMPVLKTKSV